MTSACFSVMYLKYYFYFGNTSGCFKVKIINSEKKVDAFCVLAQAVDSILEKTKCLMLCDGMDISWSLSILSLNINMTGTMSNIIAMTNFRDRI